MEKNRTDFSTDNSVSFIFSFILIDLSFKNVVYLVSLIIHLPFSF